MRWWASGGPDIVENALCLCSLHHKLLDTGVLGLTEDHRLQCRCISSLGVMRVSGWCST